MPIVRGYIVCKESVPTLVDAWRAARMDKAKALAEERAQRAIENWRRLVRGLFIWNRIKAQFALAPHMPAEPTKSTSKKRCLGRGTKTVGTAKQSGPNAATDKLSSFEFSKRTTRRAKETVIPVRSRGSKRTKKSISSVGGLSEESDMETPKENVAN